MSEEFISVYNQWLDTQKKSGKTEEILQEFSRELLHTIHEKLTAFHKESEPKGAKYIISLLSNAAKAKNSPLKNLKITSQSSYYMLIRKKGENVHKYDDWKDRVEAVLRFYNENCNVVWVFESNGSLRISVHGLPMAKIEEAVTKIVPKKTISNKYVGYYWRSDEEIGVCELELYQETKKDNYEKANLTFYYKTRTVRLEGEVEMPGGIDEATVNIKFIDNKAQRESNKRSHSFPIITSIAIFIKDISKNWSERRILFASYSSTHRKNPKHVYAGTMCFLSFESQKIRTVNYKTQVPDFVFYSLFKKRLKVLPEPNHDQVLTKSFKQSEMLKRDYAGVYKLYFLSHRDHTLEVAICKISASGEVVGKTKGRSPILNGQCIFVESEYLLINLRYKEKEKGKEDENPYPLSYAVERNVPDKCLYGAYSGINSTQSVVSGRAFFEKIDNEDNEELKSDSKEERRKSNMLIDQNAKIYDKQYEKLEPQKLSFKNEEDRKKISEIFNKNDKLYKYLLGNRHGESSDRSILEKYTIDEQGHVNTVSDVDIDGDYNVYTLQIVRNEKLKIRELHFAIYPLQINNDGSMIIKGRREPPYNGTWVYNEEMLKMSVDKPISLELSIAYNAAEPALYSKGVVVRKVSARIEARAAVFVKNTKSKFETDRYREDISIGSKDAYDIDLLLDGGLTFLRGGLNRYIIINNDADFRPRKKALRRIHFYSACYIGKASQSETKAELRRAHDHGFAIRTYDGINLFDEINNSKELIDEIRADWTLLIKETSLGGLLSDDVFIETVKQYWGDDFATFPESKGKI